MINRDLGMVLRQIRNTQDHALEDVEALTDGQFKASILGAYERGERALTVSRYLDLCRVYGVNPFQTLAKAVPQFERRRR